MATALMLATATGLVPTVFAQAPPRGSGEVQITGFVRVIDGDTLEIYVNGKRTGVGLIGIKAPLGNTACGKSAAQFLQGLLGQQGGSRLVEDLDYTFDPRKRRMYYLRLPGNASGAAEMARAGLVTPTHEGLEAGEVEAAANEAAAEPVRRGCAPLNDRE
jgi:endonuclease YncB( thermonuclease family)